MHLDQIAHTISLKPAVFQRAVLNNPFKIIVILRFGKVLPGFGVIYASVGDVQTGGFKEAVEVSLKFQHNNAYIICT